ncbi:MAG: hypothetical protein K6E85_02140 [Lachnospiraceae bacterium]|nr:hypothetical protein [Lachnospiraceae bacterium]
MPTLFCLVILFLIWFTYERKKNDTDFSKSKAFWERERKATYVPRQSMDDIKFIEFTEELIPEIKPDSSDELKAVIEDLHRLPGTKICDLSAYSNTDLRLKYGTGNFNDLSVADNNYTRLIQWSGKLLKYLDEDGRIEDGRALIDFLRKNGITSQQIAKYTEQ